MTTILGLSGSLRSRSFNTALLAAAAGMMPAGIQLEITTIQGIPLYNEDVESTEGEPKSVTVLKRQISDADGLLISTPEYNHSIPGVAKNAIDWLSRPLSDIPHIFGGRPIAIMGAAMSNFGTIQAQRAWLPVLKALGAQIWTGGRLLVSEAHNVFDASGNLVNTQIEEELRVFIEGFANHVASNE